MESNSINQGVSPSVPEVVLFVLFFIVIFTGCFFAWKILFRFPEYRDRINLKADCALVDYVHPKAFLPLIVLYLLLGAFSLIGAKLFPGETAFHGAMICLAFMIIGIFAIPLYHALKTARAYDDPRCVRALFMYELECNLALVGGLPVHAVFGYYLVITHVFKRGERALSRVYSFTGYHATDSGLKYFYVCLVVFLSIIATLIFSYHVQKTVSLVVGVLLSAWAVFLFFSTDSSEREAFFWSFLMQALAAAALASLLVWAFLIMVVFTFVFSEKSEDVPAPPQEPQRYDPYFYYGADNMIETKYRDADGHRIGIRNPPPVDS